MNAFSFLSLCCLFSSPNNYYQVLPFMDLQHFSFLHFTEFQYFLTSQPFFLSTGADPYLNTDAGTMSPFEHGEVFVLDDGGEVIFFYFDTMLIP